MKKAYSNNILKVNIAVTNMEESVQYLLDQLEAIKGEYICFSNVHTTVTAYSDAAYCQVQNEAFMALPDGRPLSLVQRLRGYEYAEQVAGPDFMIAFMKAGVERKVKHYFYGSTEETLAGLERNLKKLIPDIQIAGMESPPFRPLTEGEDQAAIERIHQSGADVIWVGLGAPKQENWMAAHQGKIHALMFGVGAGFDFHAGTVKRAPKWMRDHYLEWLYRLSQDPKRLWKRYVTTNIQFIGLIFCDMFVWRKQEDSDKPRLLIFRQSYHTPEDRKLPDWLKEQYDITMITAVPDENGRIERSYRTRQYYYETIGDENFIRIRVPEYREGYPISKVWNRLMYLYSAAMAVTRVPHQYGIILEDANRRGDRALGKIAGYLTKAAVVYDYTKLEELQREN